MKNCNEQQRRDIIIQYHISHPDESFNKVAVYFKELGIARQTVYDVLNHFKDRKSSERAQGSGKVAEKMDDKKVKKMLKEIQSNSLSMREVASKYEIHYTYVEKICKEHGVQAFKKEKRPYTTEEQREVQKVRTSKLFTQLRIDKFPSIVMDDESYFSLRHDKLPGNSFYYATARGDAPDHLRFADTKKYEQKLLVWVAISDQGISEPFFQRSGIAVNKEIYSKNCISERLLPFIQQNHSDGHYLFWPDLASAHYARLTMDTFAELAIKVVPKENNPPNVPQLRPIEDFWGLLKDRVYKNGWKSETHRQLKQRIKLCLGQIDMEVVTNMMAGIGVALKQAKYHGVESLLH